MLELNHWREKIKTKPHKGADRRSLVVEQLEQRVLFSADTLPVFETAATDEPESDALTDELYSGEKIGSPDVALLPDDNGHTLAEYLPAYTKIPDDFLSQVVEERSAVSPLDASSNNEPQDVTFPGEKSSTDEPITPAPIPGDKGSNVVFVDTTIDDTETLLEGITNNYSDSNEWLVITIDPDVDGIADITESLEGVADIDAIHIISHGDGNGFQLGNALINKDTLADYHKDFSFWSQSLTENADILIYGCDLASSENGRLIVSDISALTGADVAASIDATGHKSHNGDWDLEYSTGEIDTSVAVPDAIQSEWTGLLPAGTLEVVQSVPTAQNVNENTTLTFSTANANAVIVSDSLATTNTELQVTLSVSNGVLNLFSLSGITFISGADGSNTFTFSGTESAINSAMDGMTFTPDTGFSGVVPLDVKTELAKELNGNYTFENNDGSDSSIPFQHNGALLGDATVVTDATRGKVLSLDGNGDSMEIAHDFGQPNSVTIGGWVNLSAGAVRSEFVSIDNRVHIALDEPGNGIKGSFQITAGSWIDLNSNVFIGGTGWRHVMYSVDTTAGIQQLYIDGTIVATGTDTSSIYWAGAAVTDIGKHPGSVNYLTGMVDDVRIYTRAVAADEINALANAQVEASDTVTITVNGVNEAPQLRQPETITNGTFTGSIVNWNTTGTVTFTADSMRFGVTDAIGPHTASQTISTVAGGTYELSFDYRDDRSTLNQSLQVSVDGNSNLLTTPQIITDITGYTFVNYTYAFTADSNTATITFTDTSDTAGVANGTLAVDGYIDNISLQYISGIANTVGIIEGALQVVLNSDLEVFDTELSSLNNFGGATLTLQRNGGNNVDDLFSATGNLVFNGGTLELSSSNIGSYTNSGGQLALTFASGVTNTQVNQVMQSIAYINNSDMPPASVQIDWTFSDGNTGAQGSGGALPDIASTLVTIQPVNDSPSVSINTGANTTIGGSVVITASALNEGDPDDDGAELEYVITSVNNGYIDLTTNPGAAVTTLFTQADIDAGLVEFVHDGLSGANGSFSFVLRDGTEDGAIADSDTFVISIGGATSDSYTTDEDTDLNINAAMGLLANDGQSQSVLGGNTVFGFNASEDADGNATWSSDIGNINLTLSGATHTTSPDNAIPGITAAYDFTGSGSGATGPALESYPEISGNLDGSLEAWIYLDSLTGNNMIFDTGTSGGSGITLVTSGNDLILAAADNSFLKTSTLPGVISANTWHHLAVIVDHKPGDDSVHLYVDGTLQTQITLDLTNWAPGPFGLGTTNGSTVGGYIGDLTGQIAQFRVHDLALDSATISYHASNPGTGYATPFLDNINIQGTDGTITAYSAGNFDYSPNGQFEHLGTGQTDTDTFDYTYDDGLGNQETVTATITINGINDAPELSSMEPGSVNYVEGSPPASLTSTLTIADVDDAQLESAIVSITSNYVPEDTLTFINQSGISAWYNTGVLTLTGTANKAQYEAAIRSITYSNTSNTPSTLLRTVSIQVNDGEANSNTVTRQISVSSSNDAPTLSTIETTPLFYTENGLPITITGNLAIGDVDDTNIERATVSTGNFAFGEDILVFNDQLGITGNYDSSNGLLTLTGSAPLADYETALRTVSYENSSEDPSVADRTIWFQVDDGDTTSNPVSRVIKFTAVNDAPGLSTIEAANAFFTENGTAIAVTGNLSIADLDDTNIESARISISGNFISSEDELTFVNQPGIAGNFDSGTGTLTLTGSATLSDYENAIHSIHYQNASDNPSTLNRTVSFIVNDGDDDSNPKSRDITIIANNDAPVLSGIESSSTSYTENGLPVAITSSLIVSDLDDTNIESATATISSNYSSGEDFLQFTNQPGISGNFDNTSGVLTLTGPATLADYEAALRSISYENTSDNPSVLDRTVSFVVSDGDVNSNPQSRDIVINPVNDAPALSTIEAAPAYYTENGSPVGITGNLAINDVDDTNIESSVISISNNFASGEDYLLFTDQLGITGNFNSTTGELTLTGSATLSDYETAIHSISYENTSDNPSTLNRTVSISVSDGDASSTPLSRNIEFTAVNDAPVLSNIESSPVSYTENGPPLAVSGSIAINDIDDVNIESARISINGNYAAGEDFLLFTDQLGISGNFDGSSGVLTLNGSTTLANYETALRSVSYENTSDNPSSLDRTLSFVVNDGDADSNPQSRIVDFTDVNDAPVLSTIEAAPAVYIENGSPIGITGNLAISDIDDINIESATVSITGNFAPGEDMLSFTDQLGITGAYDTNTGVLTLSGPATPANYETAIHTVAYQNTSDNPSALDRTISFVVNDGDANSNQLSRNIKLTVVNDAPVVATVETSPANYIENNTPIIISDTVSVTDSDDTNIESATVSIVGNFTASEDLIGFVDQNGIAGTYDNTAGVLTLTGTSSLANYQSALRSVTYENTSDTPFTLPRTIEFAVNDGALDSTSISRDINITNTADLDITSPATIVINEDTSIAFTGSEIVQIDDGLPANNQVQVAVDVSNGALALSSFTGLTFIQGSNGSSSFTIQGAESDINAALAAMSYTPDPDYNGPDTLNIQLSLAADEVAHYTYEGGTADDQSAGTKHDGMFNDDATTIIDATRGEVLSLDGDEDHFWIPTTFGAPLSATMATWINVTAIDVEGATYIEGAGYGIWTDTAGPYGGGIQAFAYNGTDYQTTGTTESILGTGWRHLAMTHDATSQTLSLYLDGELIAERATTGSNSGATLVHVGAHSNTSINRDTTGLIDDTRIYTRALSSEEIATLAADKTIVSDNVSITVLPVNDAPTLATIEAAPVFYTENDPATGITGNLSIGDIDDTLIDSATVIISSNFVSTEDVLSFTSQFGINGSFDSSTGTLNLSGQALLSEYETVLHSVAYHNTSDNPSALNRSVSFIVSDGDINSNQLSRNIEFTATNDAPVLSTIESAPAFYTENSPPIGITGNLTVNDIDDTNIESATVSISNNFATGEDELLFVDQLGITGNFNAATGELTLSGTAPLADYETAIHSIGYQNTSDNPSTQNRTVSYVINDGDLNSNVLSRDINFTATNDAPVLSTIESAPAFYTENGSPIGITGNLAINDIDDTNIESAIISISGNFASGEDELSFVNQPGISGSFDAISGELTLTGSATLADYEAALHSVTYHNTSDNPSALVRTVSFTVNDGDADSNLLSRNIEFTAVNDAPVLSALESTQVFYTENGSPVAITGSLAISDVDDTNIESATVAISNNFANGEDFLLFTDQPGISGDFDSTTGTLTLTGPATVADYVTAIRSVTYENSSDNPSTLNRTISFTVNDGGKSSNTQSRDLVLTPVNDAPVLSTIESAPAFYTENGSPIGITGNLAINDIDDTNIESAIISISGNFAAGEDQLTFTDQLGITGNFDLINGVMTLTGSAALADYETAIHTIAYENTSDNPSALNRTVTFEVHDGDMNSNSLSRDIEFAAVNDPPVLSNIETTPAQYTENTAPVIISSTIGLTDVDDTQIESAIVTISSNFTPGEDVLGFATQGGISGVYNPFTGILMLSGAANVADYEATLRSVTYENSNENPSMLTRTIEFVINDGDANSNQLTRDVQINPVNDTPVLSSIESAPAFHTENALPTGLTGNLSINDVDDTNIESATITLTGNFLSAEDVLSFNDQSGITGSFDTGTGVLTLSGSATLATYEAAIHSVKYHNTSENPSVLMRTVSIQVSDGDISSNQLSRDISVTAVNDAPVLSSIENTPAGFIENGTPITVTSNILVSDVDDTNIESATVRINQNFSATEDVLTYVDQNGIVGNYDEIRDIVFNPVNDAPLLSNIEAQPASYIENETPILISSTLAVSDLDNTTLASASVVVSNNYSATEDILSFADQAGITGSYNATTGEMTLTGTASLANYQTALRSITYHSTSDDPSDLTRSISFTVSDGLVTSNELIRLIEFEAVNDAPVLSNIESLPAAFTENGAAVGITGNLQISDLDNTTIDSAEIAISGNYNAAQDTLLFTDQLGITGNYDAVNGVLSLTGDSSPANYTTAIHSIRFDNNSDNPSTDIRTVDVTVHDGTADSNQLSRQITINPINDAPDITSIEISSLTYAENEPATTITTILTLGDLDDQILQSASVSIVQNFNASEDILDFMDQSGISGSYDTASGILTLTGPASISDYETALRSITYQNTSEDPDSQPRTIEYKVYDNVSVSNTAARVIDIATINDAPQATNIEPDQLIYNENAQPVAITSTLELSDADDQNIDSATVTISGNYVAGEDILEMFDQNGISSTFDSTTGNLLLTGSATASDYENALRSVTYKNISDNPTIANRSVDITVNDGDLDSNTQSRDIALVASNDIPVQTGLELDPVFYTENSPPVSITDLISLSDLDDINIESASISITQNFNSAEDELSYTPIANIVGSFDITTGVLTLSGSATIADYQNAIRSVTYQNTSENPSDATRTIEYSINDGDADSIPLSRPLEINPVNDPPTGTDSIATFLEDNGYVLSVNDFGFSDPLDLHNFQSVTIVQLPALGSLQLSGIPVEAGQTIETTAINNGDLVFTPEAHANGVSYDGFKFRVIDDGGTQYNGVSIAIASNEISFDIINVNDPPEGENITIATEEDTTYTFNRGDFSFSDVHDNDDFTALTIGSLPESGSLSIDGNPAVSGDVISIEDIDSGLLRYVPAPNVNGLGYNGFSFQVHDSGGSANGGQFIDTSNNFVSFDVPGVNDPPLLINEGKTVDEGSDQAITTDSLSAIDTDDTQPEELTFTITSLPAHGALTLNSVPINSGASFTLEALQQDLLRYTHDGSETSIDSFEIELKDGGEDGSQPVNATFILSITEIIDPAPIIDNESVLLEFGEIYSSVEGDLLESGESSLATTVLTDNPLLTISVETQPAHGQVTLNADGTFSYQHDGTSILQDSFTYRVTNEDGIFSIATVAISIEPPVASAFDNTATAASPEAPEETPEEETENEESSTEETNNTEFELNFGQPTASTVPDEPQPDLVVIPVQPFVSDAAFVNTHEYDPLGDIAVKQHNKVKYSTVATQDTSFNATSLEIFIDTIKTRQHDVVSNQNFLEGLNRFDKELEESGSGIERRYQLASDTAIGISISATAGILAWVLRGGAIFASVMTATPLWTSIDPVRVAGGKHKQKHNRQDNVEDYFEK